MRKIILLGYMGCGKSTIAKRLSNSTGITVVDLDNSIEERTQLTVKEIFEKKGEIYFRKLERDILIELLKAPETLIIALGGGAPCYSNNHELLVGENNISIYLKGSVDTLMNRLLANRSKRPIVADKTENELKEFIAKHLFERSFYYNQAKYIVSIDNRTKDETAAEIQNILA